MNLLLSGKPIKVTIFTHLLDADLWEQVIKIENRVLLSKIWIFRDRRGEAARDWRFGPGFGQCALGNGNLHTEAGLGRSKRTKKSSEYYTRVNGRSKFGHRIGRFGVFNKNRARWAISGHFQSFHPFFRVWNSNRSLGPNYRVVQPEWCGRVKGLWSQHCDWFKLGRY